jgi:hypothetical protein
MLSQPDDKGRLCLGFRRQYSPIYHKARQLYSLHRVGVSVDLYVMQQRDAQAYAVSVKMLGL